MCDNLVKQNKIVEFCSRASVIVVGAIFYFLSIAAFIGTSYFDPENALSEKIIFKIDNVFINSLIIIGIFIIALLLTKSKIKLYKVNKLWTILVMITICVTISLSWNLLTKAIPASDSKIVTYAARDMANNDFHIFGYGPCEYCWDKDYYGGHSYFSFFDYQLGFVLFEEIIFRIFGTGGDAFLSIKIVNIIALVFAYIAVVFIVERLFKNKTITNLTAIALTFCFQPMFFTIFTYGVITGLCFSLWAVYFVILFMQDEKRVLCFILATVFIILAVLVKYNNIIVVIALAISLLLFSLDRKKILALILAIVIVVSPILSMKLVIKSYESRSGFSFDIKVNQTELLDAGLHDSINPGWYNGIQVNDIKNANMDQKKATADAKKHVTDRLNEFIKDPHKMLEFFNKKILSQYNEPSYESIWLEHVRFHDYKNGETKPAVVESVEKGPLSKVLLFYFNEYVMIMYMGFALGLIRMFLRKTCKPENIILPVIILGGYLYHNIFEAKSQYILVYFVMMIPYAIYGLYHASKFLDKRFTKLLNKS